MYDQTNKEVIQVIKTMLSAVPQCCLTGAEVKLSGWDNNRIFITRCSVFSTDYAITIQRGVDTSITILFEYIKWVQLYINMDGRCVLEIESYRSDDPRRGK
jgi:hypothetical protein